MSTRTRLTPTAVEGDESVGALPRLVRLRQCKDLNNIVEQDHSWGKKRVWLAKGYGTYRTAWHTLQGKETVHMIGKGRKSEMACQR